MYTKEYEINVSDSKFIDTSVWLDYFFKSKHREVIDSAEIVLVSVLSIFEIRKKMYKDKIDAQKIEEVMSFLQKKSLIEPVTKEIAELAVQISLKYETPAVDALIYATAQKHKAHLFTCDNDFRRLPEVTILS